MSKKSAPIGLFDSGVGGLTVASAIRNILPNEKMIYFGDTAHLPYGDKSRDSIVHYSLGIADFLLKKGCKVILLACNSASSNAYTEVSNYVKDRAIVLNVVEPVVDYVIEKADSLHTGVIGTKATIRSMTYPVELKKRNPNLEVSSLATPLFVPMIEEGFIFDDISNAIIRSYLSRNELDEIDTLILGCTHYPIIRNQISRFYNFDVNVLDSARIVAEKLQELLIKNDLLNAPPVKTHEFFVSDHTDYFEIIAKMFFGESIDLTKVNIWN